MIRAELRTSEGIKYPVAGKTIKLARVVGAIVGTDYAGTIAGVGPGVDDEKYKLGDRVAGVLHGCKYPLLYIVLSVHIIYDTTCA